MSNKCRKEICKQNIIFPPLPSVSTFIQNVPQNITSTGTFLSFQKGKNSKYVKLLNDQITIKIRKTGMYLFNLEGKIQWNSLLANKISFAILKNNIAIPETIRNRNFLSVNEFVETNSNQFFLNRGDILSFLIETTLPSNTFVPSIEKDSNIIYGNGMTLTITPYFTDSEIPNGLRTGPYTTDYLVYNSNFNGEKCILVYNTIRNESVYLFVNNIDEMEKLIQKNGFFVYCQYFFINFVDSFYSDITNLQVTDPGNVPLLFTCKYPIVRVNNNFFNSL